MTTTDASRKLGRRRGQQMLPALARFTFRYRWLVVIAASVLACLAGLVGRGVTSTLVDGGYYPSSAESAEAQRILAHDFHAGTPSLVLVAQAESPVDDPSVVAAGLHLTAWLLDQPGVVSVTSYWTTGAESLRARDEHSALVAVLLTGDEDQALRRARQLLPMATQAAPTLRLLATGLAAIDVEIQRQSEADLRRAELVGAPATALILLIVFGTLTAALLPLIIGALTVVSTLAILRLVASFTSVSLFAVNLTTALAFGLAVDYSLLIVARYREELDTGRDSREAVIRTVATAGRTVLFSATTVVFAASALLAFPLYFLRSLGYAATAVVILSATGALLVLPALLAVLGRSITRSNVLAGIGVSGQIHKESGLWRGVAIRVLRRPVLTTVGVTAVLMALALPFAHVHFGVNDERVLPPTANAYRAGELLRQQYALGELGPIEVVLPGASPMSAAVDDFARRLSMLRHVVRVDGPAGSYVGGWPIGGSGPASTRFGGPPGSWLGVVGDMTPASPAGEDLARAVRSTPAPGPELVGGVAAVQLDARHAIGSRLPWAALIILSNMSLVLFLFSGSLLIPVKAIALSLLSLTATFGAIVYVFQDGHLQWLVGEVRPTGQLEMTVPVLAFCMAFGLSMDYEVFLLSRISETYRLTGDNDRSVIAGLSHTGPLFSAAALVIATAMAALATSQLALVKLMGVGLALAVLMDASLVRGLLVPAVMRLAGPANWWAPAPARRLHQRLGLEEDAIRHDCNSSS